MIFKRDTDKREGFTLLEIMIALAVFGFVVTGLLAFLQARGDNYAAALAEPEVIRVALDRFHAEHDAPIAGAREIALFPPMTGG